MVQFIAIFLSVDDSVEGLAPAVCKLVSSARLRRGTCTSTKAAARMLGDHHAMKTLLPSLKRQDVLVRGLRNSQLCLPVLEGDPSMYIHTYIHTYSKYILYGVAG